MNFTPNETTSKFDVNSEERSADLKRVNKAITYASRLLGVREYSRRSIFQKMMSKGYSIEESNRAIDYLIENNWLSDKRFCESFIRGKSNKGQGELRILSDLKSNNIDNQIVTQALEELMIDWQSVCDKVCLKKIAMISSADHQSLRPKLYRFLTYRGFTSEQVQLSLKKHLNTGVSSNEYD